MWLNSEENLTAIIEEKCSDYNYNDYDSYGSNESEDVVSSYIPEEVEGIRFVLQCFFSVLCVFGLLANLVVMITVMYGGLKRAKPSTVYLLHLSTADVILSMSMIIQALIQEPRMFPFPNVFCKIIFGSDSFAQNLSALTLAGICWDRALLLFCPRHRTMQSAWIICTIIIFISGLASVPNWANHNVITFCPHKTIICGFNVIRGPSGNETIENDTDYGIKVGIQMIIVNFVASYVITILHLVIIGGMIILKVYRVSKRTQDRYGCSQIYYYHRLVTIRLISLIATFTVCWSPFWILALLNEFPSWYEDAYEFEYYDAFARCALYLGYVNSTVNPMIYAAMNDDFRAAFRDLLIMIRCFCRPHNIPLIIRSLFAQSKEKTGDEPLTQSLQLLTGATDSDKQKQKNGST